MSQASLGTDQEMSSFTRIAEAALHRVQQGLSTVELVHTSHPNWPLRPIAANVTPPSTTRLRISVLDSSFNPPTVAHLALINSCRPRWSPSDQEEEDGDYDAKLLLLSVRNADKALKQSDATYPQRLQMMRLLADHVVHHLPPTSSDVPNNVAVAIIDEPVFVRKSTLLLNFLRTRLSSISPLSPPPSPQLTFLLGLDTLTRLLTMSYYSSHESMLSSLRTFLSPPPEGNDSRVVCAYRLTPDVDSYRKKQDEERLALGREFMDKKRIMMIDIGAEEQAYSSTEIRDKVVEGDGSWRKMVPENVRRYIVDQKLYAQLVDRS